MINRIYKLTDQEITEVSNDISELAFIISNCNDNEVIDHFTLYKNFLDKISIIMQEAFDLGFDEGKKMDVNDLIDMFASLANDRIQAHEEKRTDKQIHSDN